MRARAGPLNWYADRCISTGEVRLSHKHIHTLL